MYSEPCAKLTMRVTPKMSDSPAATRNSDDAPARPLRSWMRRVERVTYTRARRKARAVRGELVEPRTAHPTQGSAGYPSPPSTSLRTGFDRLRANGASVGADRF